MTPIEIDVQLAARACAIVEDRGDFALVYPYGYQGRRRAQQLVAKTRAAALVEAWDWLHPEHRIAEIVDIVQHVVAADFGVAVEEFFPKTRTEPLATARRVAMVLARELSGGGLHAIGNLFLRDHATVLSAEQSVADQRETDAAFAARVGALRAACAAEIERRERKSA